MSLRRARAAPPARDPGTAAERPLNPSSVRRPSGPGCSSDALPRAGAAPPAGAEPLRTSDFRYDLPERLIARRPSGTRGGSRLLHLPAAGPLAHRRFDEFPDLLRPGDLLVRNRTRVLPARLHAVREGTGGRVELLALPDFDSPRSPEFAALTRPALPAGAPLRIGGAIRLRVGGALGDGRRTVRILEGAADVFDLASRVGRTPLPPYLRRRPAAPAGSRPVGEADDETGDPDLDEAFDRERYQTVYARDPGSVAAPTAGLHFEPAHFARLRRRGVEVADLTLHVGYGTFMPVRSADPREHRLAPERFRIPEATRAAVGAALAAGRRVVAVGTTSVRALETMGARVGVRREAAASPGAPSPASAAARPGSGPSGSLDETSLLILPGHRFRVVSALLTNFHLPESSLLLLVSALAGRDRVLAAYREAVRRRYRFYSYGDAMFVETPGPALP